MTYYVFTVTLKPAHSILPVPCDHPLSPLSVFVALICHLVLTHCVSIWNPLHSSICSSQTLDSFRKRFKPHLFHSAF